MLTGKHGARMPNYAIVLLYDPPTKPGGSGTIDREERQFANLGEALQRAREMYQHHQKSAIGFQILDAGGGLIREWRADAARTPRREVPRRRDRQRRQGHAARDRRRTRGTRNQ